MNSSSFQGILHFFWVSALLSVVIGITVGFFGGFEAVWIFIVLSVLEIVFSFDNAVVNSRVLAKLSPFWQGLFLTVGIVFAVFVIRFLLPIFIVMLIGHTGFIEVLNLAFHHPHDYAAILQKGMHSIDAFGGAFLLLIGLSYFLDHDKDIHWLGAIEKYLTHAARIRHIELYSMAVVTVILFWTVPPKHAMSVLVAAMAGIVLHTLLSLAPRLFGKKSPTGNAHQVGMAALVSFCYLEVLDASFSFDGVIGAFAITSSVLLIIAGLGIGAIWVRSLTVYLLRRGTLGKYRYLEHGAHWAILALGLIMLSKLYGIDPPEWAIGMVGLVFIGTAIISSVIEKRRQDIAH